MGVIAETAVRVKADTTGFQTGVMGAMGKVALAAGAALGGLAIGKALFADPIKSAANFEQTLNVLKQTSGATSNEMKGISSTAMKLGADIKLPGTSASDAAAAMLELAKGGFTAKESMASARGVLLLSAAAQIDNATAAQMTADTLNAFGMEAGQAMTVVDAFAGAANSSTASMGDVGAALQQSGQAFKGLGIPVGDAATAIAAMANAGIKGSDAGTSLKTMLARLTPDTKKAKEAFREMGIDVFDSSGKFIGMEKTIAMIGPKLKGLTMEQKAQKLETMFGSDASRAAAVVFGMSAKQFDNLRDKVTKAGQAQALADAQSKGFKGAMEGLRSTIQTLQLQIGLKMLPVLTTLVRFLSANLPAAAALVGSAFGVLGDAFGRISDVVRDVANWLGIFDESVKGGSHGLNGLVTTVATTQTRFQAFMGVVREVASVVGSVLSTAFGVARAAITSIIGVISSLVGWLNQNRDVAIALGAGIAAAAIAYGLYNAALAASRIALAAYTIAQTLANAAAKAFPAFAILTAIMLLVAGLVLLYQRSETARTIMNAAFNAIRSAAEAALGYITNTIIPAAIAAWDRFGPGVVAALNTAVSGIRTVIETIAGVIERVVDQIEQNWRGVWNVFGPIVKGALDSAKQTVETVIDLISGVIKVFAALLRGDWDAAWKALKGLASDALNGVKTVVTTLLTSLATTAFRLAEAIARKIASGIKTAAEKLVGLAGDLGGKVKDAVSDVAGRASGWAMEIGWNIAKGVAIGIATAPWNLASALGSKVKGGVNWVRDHGGSTMAEYAAREIGMPIMQGVVNGINANSPLLQNTLVASIRATADRAAGASKEGAKKIASEFGSIIEKAKAIWDSKSDVLVKTVEMQFTKAQAKVEQWKAKLTSSEFQLAAQAASAEVAKVRADVAAAAALLATLPAKQAQAWSALLAQQKANMDSLRATLSSATGDAVLAAHDYNQGVEAAAGNPFAAQLIYAQSTFDSAKTNFAAGLVTLAEFTASWDQLQNTKLAAQQAIDAASAASTDATEAQKIAAQQAAQGQSLLDQYNTAQTALAQQTAAGAAVTTQEATDLAARTTLETTFNEERLSATETWHGALANEQTFYLQQAAKREREERDKMAETLNRQLVARHDRFITHFDNVKKIHDRAFDDLKEVASNGGDQIGKNLANALENTIPRIARAASAVANELKKYLKLSSPSEKGPLSDLDRWWSRLAPTLVASLDTGMIKGALTDATTPALGARAGGRRLGQAATAAPSRIDGRTEQLLMRIERAIREQRATGGPVVVNVAGDTGIEASVDRSKR